MYKNYSQAIVNNGQAGNNSFKVDSLAIISLIDCPYQEYLHGNYSCCHNDIGDDCIPYSDICILHGLLKKALIKTLDLTK